MAENNETVVIDDSDDFVITWKSDEDEKGSIFQADWNNLKKPVDSDSRLVISGFFLIMELNRLVPYREDNNVKFHIMNMPHVKIGKIDVVGFVTDVKESKNFIEVLVEDGTGALTIAYERQLHNKYYKKGRKIFREYREYARNIDEVTFDDEETYPNSFPKIRPGFTYPVTTCPRKIAMLEHKWWSETKNGLLGKHIRPNDYVKATGYCHLDFQFAENSGDEITFDNLCKAKLTFMATKVQYIEEADYNTCIKQWKDVYAMERYKIHQDFTTPEEVDQNQFIKNETQW